MGHPQFGKVERRGILHLAGGSPDPEGAPFKPGFGLGGGVGEASRPCRVHSDSIATTPRTTPPEQHRLGWGTLISERSSVAESHNLAGGPRYREGAPFTGVPGEPVRWGGRSSPGLAWAGVFARDPAFAVPIPNSVSTTSRTTPPGQHRLGWATPSSERSSVSESHNLAGGPLYPEGAPFKPGFGLGGGVGEASRLCRVHSDWISTTPSSPVA
jgi:hypothetical protein